jgi:glycosyltransferase involved in cell wall biosynthesis
VKVDVLIPTKDFAQIRPALWNTLWSADWVNDIIIETSVPLSSARVRGAWLCSTEWIAMFDDDIEIPADWFDGMIASLADGVAAVSSPPESSNPHIWAYEKFINKHIRPLESLDAPFVCNTLIRRDVLMDYEPPPCFYCEDEMLYRHVKSLGRWVHTPPLGVRHYPVQKNDQARGYYWRRYRLGPSSLFFRRRLTMPVMALMAAAYSHSLGTLAFYMRLNKDAVVGWLRA